MRFAFASIATFVLSLAPVASAQTYTATRIAGLENNFISMGDGPSINDFGEVAFQAGLNTGGVAIVRASPDGAFTIIASTALGPFVTLDARPSIDRLGHSVVFGGTLGSGPGVFSGDGVSINTIAAAPEFQTIMGSPVAQPGANGAAVFVGQRPGNSIAIFRGDGGGSPVVLAGANDNLTSFGNNTGVNAAGAIAFRATLTGTGQGIYLRSNGVTTPLATLFPVLSGFGGNVALNSSNQAAFRANLARGGQAIIIATINGWSIFADTSGEYASFNVPAINDAGEVVFRAVTDSGGIGVFNGPNPAIDRIMTVGDAFDGSIVASLEVHALAINNRGQFVFRANLSDGRQTIVRADPPPCPADIALDRKVNVSDLLAVITSWGACENCNPPSACPADIAPAVHDCQVNVTDLLAVITSWGACP